MPCLYCKASFSLIKWKKKCSFCTHLFCSNCIVQKRCLACAHVLNCQGKYDSLMNVKVKDLKLYLTVRGAPIHLYNEKEQLVRLVILKNDESSARRVDNRTPSDLRSQTGRRDSVQHSSQETNAFETGDHDVPLNYGLSRPNVSTENENRTSWIYNTPVHNPSQDDGEVTQQSNLTSPESGAEANFNHSSEISVNNSDERTDADLRRPVPTGLGNKIVIGDIASVGQIELLTPRELKQILHDNFINYKGCLEKSELRIKVQSLYEDKSKNKQVDSIDPSSDDNLCRICWDEAIDCVFLDCGHMATCTACGKRMNECPICRQYIVKCVHVFRT